MAYEPSSLYDLGYSSFGTPSEFNFLTPEESWDAGDYGRQPVVFQSSKTTPAQTSTSNNYAQIPSDYSSQPNPAMQMLLAQQAATRNQPKSNPVAASVPPASGAQTGRYARGPQAIPEGTPGTYVSGGGRVIPDWYKPIASAQTAYAHGAGGGEDMQTYMTNAGYGTDFYNALSSKGMELGGGPSAGWNWNSMSTPYMDAMSGHSAVNMSSLLSKYKASPDEIAAYEAEGNPPSWYVPGATSFDQVIAKAKYESETGLPLTMQELNMKG